MSKYRVLFVDDEEAVRRPLGRYFSELGHEVFLAANGKEGIALHEQNDPHVTVLDLRMPGMSGMDVLDVLRKRSAIVVMLTAHGDVQTAVQAIQMGAENFLQKPVDMPHLVAAVEKAAEKAVLRRENQQLRARLAPGLKARMGQAALVLVLLLAAIAVGWAIGGDRGERPSRPIPVPIEPRDTLTPRAAPPPFQGDSNPAR